MFLYDFNKCRPLTNEDLKNEKRDGVKVIIAQTYYFNSTEILLKELKKYSIVVILDNDFLINYNGYIRFFGITEEMINTKKINNKKMKNYIYIGERQSGKSTKALDKFMENPENTLLISNGASARNNFNEILNKTYYIPLGLDINKHSYSINNLLKVLNGNFFDRIIFDEFFYMDEEIIKNTWPKLLSIIRNGNDCGISIYSSYNNEYGKSLGQEKFVNNLIKQGWKLIEIKGGIEEKINYSIFPFDNSI